MIADESLVTCAPRDRRGQQRTDGRGLKSDNGLDTDFTVGLHTRHEPGRSFFVHDLGKLLGPDPTGVPSQRISSGLVLRGGVSAEEQISKISMIR